MTDDMVLALRQAITPLLNVASLTDLYAVYKSVPTNYALVGHCLFAATMAPDFKHRFLVHFWITFLAGFGGGVLSSFLMMDPVRAPINILANNTLGVTWFACWWLMVYSPFNVVGRLHSLLPVRMLTKVCVSFFRANLIIARVDLAVAMYPGVIAAPLILGTLAGSGGKFITDGIRGGWGMLPGAAEASVPSFVWRSAALAAAGYWGACKATGLLSSQEAAALVITVLVVHSLLSDLLGAAATDFTYPVAKVAHTLSLVPLPSTSSSPAAAAATKASKKAAEPARQSAVIAHTGNGGAQVKPAAATAAAPAPSKPASGKNNAAGAAAVKADNSSKKNVDSKKGR